ncbi:nuclear transport factor 2 family protein [Leifsonia sp. F6_8S_P_1B]|uniref:Nuclear transport factor 2 family protein n=1 Tax=Leifsonia williamsii TaxID=3035919 RepID=A0ABT8K6W7_9MICO|nr:nuclear transport factor 2 family protein [Leifsonia williamsii]MDN4613190.1 nuclear transport factor 2 family protein [Leifsonia williamsii]
MPDIQLPPPVQRFVDATNRGDSEAFVDVFTDDAYLNDWGREFHGHDGVRDWDRTDNIGVNSHFDVVGIEPGPDADTVVVTMTVSGDGYNGTGPLVFGLRGDRIASLRIS